MKNVSRRRRSAVIGAVVEGLDGRVLLSATDLTATASFQNTPKPGDTSQQFQVSYFDDVAAIDASTLDANDVTLTFTPAVAGGQTVTVPVTLQSSEANGTAASETFTFAPVGGSFGVPGGEGTYTVSLNANQVADVAGNTAAAGTISNPFDSDASGTPVTITTPSGPITDISVSTRGQLQVLTSQFMSGQFFSPSRYPGNAGITIRTTDPTSGTVQSFGFNGGSSDLTATSQTISQDGHTVTTVIDGGTANDTPFRITQTVSYTPGDQFFTVTNSVQNTGPTAYHFDFFFTSDLYLADSDAGFAFFNPQNNAVGGTDPTGQYNIFFQGVPGQIQPTNYQEDQYSNVTRVPSQIDPPQDLSNTVLPNTIQSGSNAGQPNIVDNGAGIEWKDQVLAPGSSTVLPFFAAFGNVTSAGSGPSASVSSGLQASSTSAPFDFPVTYTDSNTVNASTLDNGDIVVTGPNNFSAAATLVSTGLANGTTVVATYRVAPPAGGFVGGGTYSVVLQGGAVADTQGGLTAGGTIGSFTINASQPVVRGSTLSIGGLDTSFGGGDGVAKITLANQNARTVGIVSQGDKLVVAVTFTPAAGGNSDFELFRLNADGSIDTSFGNGGFATANFPAGSGVGAVANNVEILRDGRILLVGTAGSTTDGTADLAAARFTPDGQLDTTFGNGTGRVVQDLTAARGLAAPSNDVARTVLVNNDGSFYVGGYSDARQGALGDFMVARFTAAGALDPSFASTGAAFAPLDGDAAVNALLVLPGKSGGILAVGSDVAGGQSQIAAVKFLNNGTIDGKFGANGRFKTTATGANAEGSTAALESFSGKIVIGGTVLQGALATPTASSFALVRITSKGKLDRSFSKDGIVTTSFANTPFGQSYAGVTTLTITGGKKDERILASGKSATTFATALSRDRGIALARYDAKGNLDTSFGIGGQNVLLTPDTLGSFSAANDNLANAFDAFTADAQGAVAMTTGGGIRALASDTNTQNTSVFVAAIVPDGVDLQGTLAQVAPTSVIGGAKGKATVSVRNAGSQTARGNVPIQLYASTDPALSTDDVLVGSPANFKANLAPGKSKAAKLNFTFPTSLNGNYFLIALVNSGNSPALGEINLNNNAAPSGSAVRIAPANVDLSGTFANLPSTLTSGQKITLTVNVKNQSTANSTAKGNVTLNLFQSADQTLDNADTAIGSATGKVNLKPGQTRAVKFTLTLPTLPPGSDLLLGTLTFNGSPADANAANNTLFSAGQITFQ